MEIKTTYNLGDKLYKLEAGNTLKTIEIVGIRVYVDGIDKIKTQYLAKSEGQIMNTYYWEYEFTKYGYFDSIEELKKDAMLKLLNI
jgi:hypothetical protein